MVRALCLSKPLKNLVFFMYKNRREISIKSLMAVLRRLSPYSVTLGVMFVVVINEAEDSSKNRKADDSFIKGSSSLYFGCSIINVYVVRFLKVEILIRRIRHVAGCARFSIRVKQRFLRKDRRNWNCV